MIGLSAGIASLGLMLNSPAVIIGAMLVAPLMAAILDLGMVQADIRLLGLSGSATLRGMLLAILMGVAAGMILPDAQPTAEVMSRTTPSLLIVIPTTTLNPVVPPIATPEPAVE